MYRLTPCTGRHVVLCLGQPNVSKLRTLLSYVASHFDLSVHIPAAVSGLHVCCGISPRSGVVTSRDPNADQRAPPDVRGNDARHLTKGGNTGMAVWRLCQQTSCVARTAWGFKRQCQLLNFVSVLQLSHRGGIPRTQKLTPLPLPPLC